MNWVTTNPHSGRAGSRSRWESTLGSAGRHGREHAPRLVGVAIVDLHFVVVGAGFGGGGEVVRPVGGELADRADERADDRADDDAEADQAPEAATVEREQQREQQAPDEAEQRASSGAEQRGTAARQTSGDVLDIAEPGADDRDPLDRELVIREPVDRLLRVPVGGGRADGATRALDGGGC